MILKIKKIINSVPEYFELTEESKKELIDLIDKRIEKREKVIQTNEKLDQIKKRGREECLASKWYYKEVE